MSTGTIRASSHRQGVRVHPRRRGHRALLPSEALSAGARCSNCCARASAWSSQPRSPRRPARWRSPAHRGLAFFSASRRGNPPRRGVRSLRPALRVRSPLPPHPRARRSPTTQAGERQGVASAATGPARWCAVQPRHPLSAASSGASVHGSERGPVALPVFKIGRPCSRGGLGSTPRRFRHSMRPGHLEGLASGGLSTRVGECDAGPMKATPRGLKPHDSATAR